MGQTEIIIDLIQSQLLPYVCLVFAQCRNAPSNSGDMLAQVEIEALDEGGVDVPTTRREHLLDGLQSPEHDAVAHAHQAPPPHGLDHLRVAQLRQGQPARLRCRACGLASWRLQPVAIGVSKAVRDSLTPSVSNSGTQSGANTCPT